MSLSKGISFLLYALVGTPSVHGYPLVFNLGYAQNSPDSNLYSRGTVESITVGASVISKNISLQVTDISCVLRYRRF